MTTEQSWQQQCRDIQHACSISNWSQVIQECNELIRYAQEQSGVAAAAAATAQNNAQQTYESNEQLQMHIQAHAEQD